MDALRGKTTRSVFLAGMDRAVTVAMLAILIPAQAQARQSTPGSRFCAGLGAGFGRVSESEGGPSDGRPLVHGQLGIRATDAVAAVLELAA